MLKKINYYSRNFVDVRQDLIDFVKQYYPSIFNDFNDASVGMMFLELNAAVGDMLSFHTDRMFQETQIDYAQERKSLLSLARTLGLKVPGKRPSIAIVDFEVTVPISYNGDSPDLTYAPIVKKGTQATGGGQVFETIYDIDFSSPFTLGGIPNWLVLPQVDSNNNIVNYKLVKRELVVNGQTKIYKRVIKIDDVKPFLEVVLPDANVLSIESIITLPGIAYTDTPTNDSFYVFNDRWFEVDALAEDKVFIEDTTKSSNDSSIKPGRYVKTDRRFITEYTDNGFKKIIFGSGSQDVSSLGNFNINPELVNRIGDIINNMALGQTPRANTTMFINYRVGGGNNTNLGSNTISQLGLTDVRVNGANPTINTAVQRSFLVRQSSLAIGGKDEPTVDEIRYLIKYNFSAQRRAVTIKDYLSVIKTMPSEFGVPFRFNVFEQKNKINIDILTLNSGGQLSNESNQILRDNISNFLSDYRMINDYVEVNNGKIFNLAYEIDIYADKGISISEISNNVINTVKTYNDINKYEMGMDLYISPLLENINNVNGVINVIDIRVYNKSGIGYSLDEVSQTILDETTRQIDISDSYTVFNEPNAMFEIKYPDRDIKIRVKTRT